MGARRLRSELHSVERSSVARIGAPVERSSAVWIDDRGAKSEVFEIGALRGSELCSVERSSAAGIGTPRRESMIEVFEIGARRGSELRSVERISVAGIGARRRGLEIGDGQGMKRSD
ncbi:hypothetical protein SO802_027061 [Lithocarpus litseifolius]|uniref:Uncharacterized protein n=1 Tax=Lithocarpus litseifolius TaxID=425828 RepID=A0AAW2C1M4_9ROSI